MIYMANSSDEKQLQAEARLELLRAIKEIAKVQADSAEQAGGETVRALADAYALVCNADKPRSGKATGF